MKKVPQASLCPIILAMKVDEWSVCILVFILIFNDCCYSINAFQSTNMISFTRPILNAGLKHRFRMAGTCQCRWEKYSRKLTLDIHCTREVDPIERVVGGARYEYVPIPESMKATTIYVGNICEFAHDDDLSALFQKVSKLHSVPACIARKVDTSSLQYGFVSFPTVEEKEVGRY
jgi:hypothetical protein